MQELLDNEDLKVEMFKDYYVAGKSAGLHGFEQVKRFKLVT